MATKVEGEVPPEASAPIPEAVARSLGDESRPLLPPGIARKAVLGLILAFVAGVPLVVKQFEADWISLALVYVIIGLSINILMGYAGQISLGHQAFVGVGAFTSAIIVSKADMPFPVGMAAAAATGAVAAVALGLVALRLKGLYLALITLAYGAIAEGTLFSIGSLTGGGAGTSAPRPPGFTSNRAYVYLCLLVLALLFLVDWRLIRSKAGRAILAIRENELAAASFGINVVAYKLMAFVLSGAFAGIAGSLFAHRRTVVVGVDFDFTRALTFVLMAVVGGLGSRAGIFIASAFFALFPLVFNSLTVYVPLIGAALLLITLTLNPGGIAQQLKPVSDWLAGEPFRLRHPPKLKSRGGDAQA
jgi:branched-chain amino acid transport system permease protein